MCYHIMDDGGKFISSKLQNESVDTDPTIKRDDNNVLPRMIAEYYSMVYIVSNVSKCYVI